MANTTLILKEGKELVQIGKNVLAAPLDDGRLVLVIDPNKEVGKAASGSGNIIIATTSGNISVGEAKLGLNMYRKPSFDL